MSKWSELNQEKPLLIAFQNEFENVPNMKYYSVVTFDLYNIIIIVEYAVEKFD
jgi:hypothetical protein